MDNETDTCLGCGINSGGCFVLGDEMSDTHSFDVDVAKEVGVNAAILLQSIKWWCEKNKANGKHYHEGLYWTYNSAKAWQELYPYLGKGAINTALKKLEERGYIRTGNYNKSAYDRTKWYAITDDGLSLFGNSICQNREMEELESGNGFTENEEPIPVASQLRPTDTQTVVGDSHAQKSRERFRKPTLEEVTTYCQERDNGIDPQHFIDYQDARGWKLKGGQQIKDWKAVIRTWERFEKNGFDAQKHKRDLPKSQMQFIDDVPLTDNGEEYEDIDC